MEKFKWLYPGIKIKRWVMVCILGIIMVSIGSIDLVSPDYISVRILGGFTLFLGIALIFVGLERTVKSFLSVFLPLKEEKKVFDLIYQKRQLARGPRFVVIGGGTGLSTLLYGLKEYTSNITAIVTVADEGGSSGRLREQFGLLAPGDIRNCLVALADTEPLMRNLFQFRFGGRAELDGHSFGNLFITAMTKITGDFEKAVKESSKVLAIRGQVVPSTLEEVRLVAEYEDGTRVIGESKISKQKKPIKRIYLNQRDCQAAPEAVSALKEADVVVIGPGSLYTSVIPNLLIEGINRAILESKAIKIYVCNIMTQSGETDNYKASDHIEALVAHAKSKLIDYCILNFARIPAQFLEKYKQEDAHPVLADVEKIEEMGFSVIKDNLVSAKDCVRHDAQKLAGIIVDLIEAKAKVNEPV
ncbi:MAG: YvcK family protein [Candidatus Omnitrophica bacterium]|nr:YvcK family protein [Candidatus Omnitrophota bacterium]MBU4140959.1 YvcK family protein [Candidatus Omnitrophota bacterium]